MLNDAYLSIISVMFYSREVGKYWNDTMSISNNNYFIGFKWLHGNGEIMEDNIQYFFVLCVITLWMTR